MSPASIRSGMAASSAETFSVKSGFDSAALLAAASLFLMFPERYASAVSHADVSGFKKITPLRSEIISLFSFPSISSDMKSRSTPAFSEMETARASAAVSVCVILTGGCKVRFVKMSALPISLPSLTFSSERTRGSETSSRKMSLLVLSFNNPFFFVKSS